jgi:hypothetical protein
VTSRSIAGIAALALLLVGASAAAQKKDEKKREAQLRTVRGTVVDREENAVSSSVVFLKNVRTQVVRTYIADDNGAYRFSGLDPNVDYEIHAEHNDLASAKRTISSFDSRKEIIVTLKLSRKREK